VCSSDLARSGHVVPILVDLYELCSEGPALNDARNFIAGLDIEPPEARAVPLTEADFQSKEEYERIMRPWRVSDERGRALPMWGGARPLYGPKGRVNAAGCRLVSPDVPLPEAAPAVAALAGYRDVAAQ
jgi:hypothetical protein